MLFSASNNARHCLQQQRESRAATGMSSPIASTAVTALVAATVSTTVPALPRGVGASSTAAAASAAAGSAASPSTKSSRKGTSATSKRKSAGSARSLDSPLQAAAAATPANADDAVAMDTDVDDKLKADPFDFNQHEADQQRSPASSRAATGGRGPASASSPSLSLASQRYPQLAATSGEAASHEAALTLSEENLVYADSSEEVLDAPGSTEYTAVIDKLRERDGYLSLLNAPAMSVSSEKLMRWAKHSARALQQAEMEHFLFQCFAVVQGWLLHLRPAAASEEASHSSAASVASDATAVPIVSLKTVIQPWQQILDITPPTNMAVANIFGSAKAIFAAYAR